MQGTLFKVGGSLFDWPELPIRLHELLQKTSAPLLIAGGGAVADAVRHWDATFHLGDAPAHRLAMQSLTLSARLLEQLLPQAVCVASLQEIHTARENQQIPVLLVEPLVSQFEPYADIPLAANWESTSDSLSLWLAWHLGLAEVTLLKSADWMADLTWDAAANVQLVDKNFPALARFMTQQHANAKLSWCNLRKSTNQHHVFGT
ncbi:amino acid kinase family protein [Rubinisphaera brasiliensis]|uniref:Uncharacterized aspartokinase uridylate kinase-like protein n=1 Tax=Rubinisphaera brasiliensis (strain ATCC 49424 / DSM 5305 / JCM 21570 / IAM 15109 / NBRC 103401 / IFAM 1448) TaxID=756272 RepID=F0SIE6_RUBBR|nr:aspartokinase uridylate kinase [Rubinisphaera brasiliensis]ADY58535.1 uncharacterized aspartokinase uridylate kinase-like protein [Rubinisphaera brasiliensis DSM 5305]